MNEFFRQVGGDARRIWEQMTAAQRVLVGVVIAATIALFAFLVFWAQQPSYVPLFSKLGDKDAGEIVQKLKDQGVPYKIEGTEIRVPESQVHELRLSLAGQGLPSGGTVGFGDLFNGQMSFSQTDFEKKLNYQRGLEGELARTIGAIEGVSAARVHIVIPKDSLFIEDEQQTTASVLLTMQPMAKLELEQVKTIQHLVSKAVPKLSMDNVFVTDTAGRDYTEEMAKLDPKNLSGTDLSARQMDIKKKYEKDLQHKIQSQLDTVLGQDQAVVRVDTKWDFSQIETNAESYTPSVGQQGGVLLSEKYKNETYNGRFNGDGGQPGNNTNVAPDYQQVDGQNGNGVYNNNEGTRNYDVNKEVQRRIKEPAVLKDTTVSVAYNIPRSLRPQGNNAGVVPDPESPVIKKYSDYIGKMVGLAAGIEDYKAKVAVNPMVFNNSAAIADSRAAADAAWWKRAYDFGLIAASIIVGLIALLLGFLSFRRRRQEELQEIEEALPRLPSDDLGITIITDEPELQGVVADHSALGALPPPSADEQRLQEMQRELANFIKGQPKDAVKLVRAWMTEDE
jgi:flagellar M-ring protein FliF